jgi:hypothetical protein
MAQQRLASVLACGALAVGYGCGEDEDNAQSSTATSSTSTTSGGGMAGAGGIGGSSSSSGTGGATGGNGGSGAAGGMGGSMGGMGGAGGGAIGAIVINEIVAANANPNGEDWIEFFNPTTVPIDISGYTFTDDDPNHVYTFPANTTLGADAYLVLVRNAPNSFTFGFSAGNGDEAHLYDPNSSEVDGTTMGPGVAVAPNSWGRWPNGSGAFQVLTTPTEGAVNTNQ